MAAQLTLTKALFFRDDALWMILARRSFPVPVEHSGHGALEFLLRDPWNTAFTERPEEHHGYVQGHLFPEIPNEPGQSIVPFALFNARQRLGDPRRIGIGRGEYRRFCPLPTPDT